MVIICLSLIFLGIVIFIAETSSRHDKGNGLSYDSFDYFNTYYLELIDDAMMGDKEAINELKELGYFF